MSATDQSTDWTGIRCARMRIEDLRVLADFRGRLEIRVLIAGDRAWVCWPAGSEIVGPILSGRILPLEGVELFTERGGHWYRLGAHLPALDVPFRDLEEGIELDRVLIPGKLSAQRSAGRVMESLRVIVVPEEQGRIRPATAMRCSLAVLTRWAGQATSAQIERLEGAWLPATGETEADAEVLVRGLPGNLPHLRESTRYWGGELLVPLGFRPEPELPAGAIRAVVGAEDDDVVVLDGAGIELIPGGAFRLLSRAAVRLAGRSLSASGPEGGRVT